MQHTLKALAVGLASIVGLFLLLQLVPYGRTHSNPPTVVEPAWDSPRTRELAVRACFDCHSNQTRWPWYRMAHPQADLTPAEWTELARGLEATLGGPDQP